MACYKLSVDHEEMYFNKSSISRKGKLLLLVGCLTSLQHVIRSQGRIFTDNCACCQNEIEFAYQTSYLTQSQYTASGQQVLVLTRKHLMPCRTVTGVPIVMTLASLDLGNNNSNNNSNNDNKNNNNDDDDDVNNKNNNDDDDDDNDNNNRIYWRSSTFFFFFFFFFTLSSLRHEPSPTHTLKWPRRNHVQITCNTSSAYHVQLVLRVTRYEGTARLLSLTKFKSRLFELLFYWLNH